ncbi:MAG: hypothetical protein QM726_11380 [Chitinophagaceae bacterium]
MLQEKLKSICRFFIPTKKSYNSTIVETGAKPKDQQINIVYKSTAKENAINEMAAVESEWWIN